MAINEFVKETVVGLLYGIFMWGTKFSSPPPYISRRSCRRPSSLHGGGGVDDEKGYQYHGLGIALDPPPPLEVENPRKDDDEKKTRLILKSCMAPPPPSPSPPSFFTLMPSELSSLWTKSTTGDFLGTESGVHMVSAAASAAVELPWENPNPSLDKTTTCRRFKVKQEMKRWDIPPPLTWLQRRRLEYNAGDHHHSYSLNREYINGRLVIKEVEVEDFVEIENVQGTGGEDTRCRRLYIDLMVAEDDDQENSFPAVDDDDDDDDDDMD